MRLGGVYGAKQWSRKRQYDGSPVVAESGTWFTSALLQRNDALVTAVKCFLVGSERKNLRICCRALSCMAMPRVIILVTSAPKLSQFRQWLSLTNLFSRPPIELIFEARYTLLDPMQDLINSSKAINPSSVLVNVIHDNLNQAQVDILKKIAPHIGEFKYQPNPDGVQQVNPYSIRHFQDVELFKKANKLRSLTIRPSSRLANFSQLHVSGNLVKLSLEKAPVKNLLSLGSLPRLETLTWKSGQLESLKGIENCPNVKYVDLRLNPYLIEIEDIKRCSGMQVLELGYASNLKSLKGVEGCLSLDKLDLSTCTNISSIHELEKCEKLSSLNVESCVKIESIEALDGKECLIHLDLSGCVKIKSIQPLKRCFNLERLDMSGLGKVQSLHSLEGCKNLQALLLSNCESITNVGPLIKLEELRVLDLKGCVKMERLNWIKRCKNLAMINVEGCTRICKEDLVEIRGSFPELEICTGRAVS